MEKLVRNKKVVRLSLLSEVKRVLRRGRLHTVCEESKCPNIGECFSKKTATFLILGDACTRNCRYCSVRTGPVRPPDPDEPRRLAEAVKKLGIRYAVITSVTRDDLPDGGASHFAACVRELKSSLPSVKVEVLTPDFRGRTESAALVLKEEPFVFAVNLETVKRLYPTVRPGGRYEWTLKLLKFAKENFPSVRTKSGIMVGLGETWDDLRRAFDDLKEAGCEVLTVGQYLQPTKRQMPVVKEYSEEEFKKVEELAREAGFKFVFAGRWVRSSYRAWQLAD
ncbi:MAG: lipoyl synthase [Aquificae bacterium]|nr:lipoyl synthase [Aquificota bacterium]